MQQIIQRYAREVLASANDREGASLPPGALAFWASAQFAHDSAKSLLVILPTNTEAELRAQEATTFLDKDLVEYFPGYESLPYRYLGHSSDIALDRLRVLARLLAGDRLLVFASVPALLRKIPERSVIEEWRINAVVDQEWAPHDLLRRLIALGYQRVDRVESPGDCCLKGEILDVFPSNSERPLRFDYFDDIIESLRYFDPATQVGGEKVSSAQIMPAGEIILPPELAEQLRSTLDGFSAELDRPGWVAQNDDHSTDAITQFLHHGVEELFPLVMESSPFADFVSQPLQAVHYPEAHVKEAVARLWREFRAVHEQQKDRRITVPPDALLWSDLEKATGLKSKGFSALPKIGRDDDAEDEAENDSGDRATSPPIDSYDNPLQLKEVTGFSGRMPEVRAHFSELVQNKEATICIASPYAAQLRRIAGVFRGEEDVEIQILEKTDAPPQLKRKRAKKSKPAIFLIRSPQEGGFACEALHFYLYTDAEIFGRSYRKRSRFKRVGSAPIDSFLDLKEGDFIVHVNHGVGRFLKLERVRAAGRERDFMVMEYADEDRLYVPLDQISMVQRYVAPTEKPRLDSLGKASFKKTRERVEKKIEEFAGELIRLYAIRMSRKGFAFPADTAWQERFESDFPYEETPDQISAIEAVKNDMEEPRPMDRLICGDVGYGKTEVAIRATFKAVMGGKQVVIIAPTTILALQHFRTFRDRFKEYPISVDWISRFRTRGQVRKIKQSLLAGEIDVVIGTHALLSGDIHVRNLGLLVVDEEQRFGVTHKEAIKKMRHLVDVLTLSATPIPRTLHMSLVGIRDLSVISTPPGDRLPVRTYVMEDNDSILREAMERELERDGQIFYLHNRIDSIEGVADRMQQLLPQLRIAVVHGRLDEDEIEDTLLRFTERRFDLLVTTTIIENGIDMPNVNTLIVDRADTFGLSQLYQIRGRVGRSNRQAYAYLLYRNDRPLSEVAQKRLNTILEYQDFGSGLKVAMRDLEIRGAGNILGREQSGTILDIGYELYVKLLDEAVHRLKGEPLPSELRPALNLKTDYFLPEEYIVDTRQRIEFYKRFEAATSEEEVDRLAGEMEDRFGSMPAVAKVFVEVERIRTLAAIAGFESVYEDDDGRVNLVGGEHLRIPGPHVIACLHRNPRLALHPSTPNILRVQPGASSPDDGDELAELRAIMHELAEPLLPGREIA